MGSYRLGQVALDCNDLDLLISFWTRAIGYELDHRESAGKNPIHLDITVPDEKAHHWTALSDPEATIVKDPYKGNRRSTSCRTILRTVARREESFSGSLIDDRKSSNAMVS